MWSLRAAYCAGGCSTGEAVTVSRNEAVRESADSAEWLGGDEVPEEAPSDGWLASEDRREGEVTGKLSSRSHQPGSVFHILTSKRIVVEFNPLPGCAGGKLGQQCPESLYPEGTKCAVSVEDENAW